MMRRILVILCCLLLQPVTGSASVLHLDIQVTDEELHETLEAGLIPPSYLQSHDEFNPRLINHYQRQLPKIVNDILEPYGFFYSQTKTRLEQGDAEEYELVIMVDQGKPLLITNLDIKIISATADAEQLQMLAQNFPLKVGDVLRQDRYKEGKVALIQGAKKLGYLDANFQQHEIRVHRGDRQAAISLILKSGDLYRFGPTVFDKNGGYPELFLRRFLTYREGDLFSHQQTGQTHLNLLDADLFRTINIRPLLSQSQDRKVPIQIELESVPRHRFRPGVGYGSDMGARVSLDYRTLNLFNRAHEFNGELSLAQREQSILSTYIIPDLNRLDSRTLLRVGFDHEETDSYEDHKVFGEIEYQRLLAKGLIGSVFMRMSSEYSLISDEEMRAKMLLPGVRFSWRQVDDPLKPRRGFQIKAELQGAEDSFFSDTSLVQLFGQVTHLQPLPQEFSFFLKLQGGTTWHYDEFNDLPASLRYFAGGDHSVRGYGYQTLGPEDNDGEVIGGKHLLVANFEMEKRLTPDWGVAVFYDLGNAFNSFADFELEQGAGIGVRRYTPIGAIGLDLARQIGNDENSYRLHLSVGLGW